MGDFDVAPQLGESRKLWLARLLREGCPPSRWCELADAHQATQHLDEQMDVGLVDCEACDDDGVSFTTGEQCVACDGRGMREP